MTYDETRENEQLRLLAPVIDEFITAYKNHQPGDSPCTRRTIFFFPGGMASQLTRARKKYDDSISATQTFQYDPVWFVAESLFFGAPNLAMYRTGADTFRDNEDRIIIADGSVNLLGCTPHEGFIDWCAKNNADLFVFDWDWRRRLDETSNFFVDKFLPFFQARVLGEGCADPLASFALVGHSFGGMIVNLIVRRGDPSIDNVTHAITVGTPFYGYAGQAHRWFEGDAYVNGPWNIWRRDGIKVISSFPALYTLHFLDEDTYNANQAALASDAVAPLNDYPSMDAANPGQHADPYNPQTNGNLVRYPENLGFDSDELEHARDQFRMMADTMDAKALAKLYCIRGIRTVNDTVGTVTCGWIKRNFKPRKPSAILDSSAMPGDATQPAWTARLASMNKANCREAIGSDIEHMFLMSNAATLQAIGSILCGTEVPMDDSEVPVDDPDSTQPATFEEAMRFVDWLQRPENRTKKWPSLDDPRLLESIPREFRKNFGRIARRIMMDIFKRPTPNRGRPERGTPPAKPGKGPSAKDKTVPASGKPKKAAGKAKKKSPPRPALVKAKAGAGKAAKKSSARPVAAKKKSGAVKAPVRRSRARSGKK